MGGYLSLIYKLYKIKKEYFKERKLYKQTIKLFPNLIYPDIKTLNDYNDSIRVKFHLSYMLGETLIKADKNKFKGGYLTLFKDIKQTHKDYKTIKQLLSDFNITSPTIYNAITDNKEIFIKNLNKIEDILKTHKDYQAIIDNILHNFDYVLKHLDLIQEWLLSDDFYQKYKKENHPYPSLLDPKKLNDENEIDFVYIGFGLSGNSALAAMFRKLNWKFLRINLISKNDVKAKSNLLSYYNKHKIVMLVRDPIERLQTGLNHGTYFSINQKPYDRYLLSIDHIDDMINRVRYIEYDDQSTVCFELNKWINGASFGYASIINNIGCERTIYIDMSEILPNNVLKSLTKLSRILNLHAPREKDENYFKEIKNGKFRFILPIIIDFKEVSFYVTLKNQTNNIVINHFFKLKSKLKDEIAFSINKEQMILFEEYCKDIYIFKKLNVFFEIFLNKLLKKINRIKESKIKEDNILKYLFLDKQLRVQLKQMLDNELVYLKQYRPDIVASWKYYQEFEKMCEELDGEDEIEQEQVKNNN